MSWTQEFSIPKVEDLLTSIAGKDSITLLKEYLKTKGIEVVNADEFEIDSYSGAMGHRVVLSDGRIFVTKLLRKETTRGNWGCDFYTWCLEGEEPKVVEQINRDDNMLL